MKFQIQESAKIRLIPVTLRLRPVTIGKLRKLSFDNHLTMQELANQMIEHCMKELSDGTKQDL